MKKFLKLIYQFFIAVYLFESSSNPRGFRKKNISFVFVKSLKDTKANAALKKYFKKNKFQLKRLKKKSKFVGLISKGEIICSGWIYFGKDEWNITEINKKIKLDNQYLLYDFITGVKFRNMGYYRLLLKIIQNKFQRKKLMIYSLSHNRKSIRAIEKSGFKLIKKLKKF